MKHKNLLLGLTTSVLLFASLCANATYHNHMHFLWQGVADPDPLGQSFPVYTVEGKFTYFDPIDPNNPVVWANGGSTEGIQELSVSFFDQNHVLLFTAKDVSGGSPLYPFLSFTFDTNLQQIVGDANGGFNLGMAAADGDIYVAGFIGDDSYVYDYTSGNPVSYQGNTAFTVYVPEPSTIALLTIGLAGLGIRGRKKAC